MVANKHVHEVEAKTFGTYSDREMLAQTFFTAKPAVADPPTLDDSRRAKRHVLGVEGKSTGERLELSETWCIGDAAGFAARDCGPDGCRLVCDKR
jgi:hypothetical protein